LDLDRECMHCCTGNNDDMMSVPCLNMQHQHYITY